MQYGKYTLKSVDQKIKVHTELIYQIILRSILIGYIYQIEGIYEYAISKKK